MMFEPVDTPKGSSVLDPEGIVPVIAIATGADLDELRGWLSELDEDVYGRVFIEAVAKADALGNETSPLADAALAASLAELPLPERVGVTWLQPVVLPGIALQGAVDAWLTEWLWVDVTATRSLQMFTAQHAQQTIAPYLQRFECRLEKRWPGCSQENCPKLRVSE